MPFDGKAMLKGGWHPAGDKQIKKETWKSDLKGLATGKKKDPYAEQRDNHVAAPLTTLRDPDAFGPPPKARSHYDEQGQALNPVAVARRTGTGMSAGGGGPAIPQSLAAIPTEHRGGLGAPVVETGYKERREREMREREAREQEQLNVERGPYQKDTTGIDTRNFAPPPRHYAVGGGLGGGGASPAAAAGQQARASPALPPRVPPRQTTGTLPPPPPPARQATSTIAAQNSGPKPYLPPRQNEYPDEHTPAPPPTYGEALNAPSPPAQTVSNKFETAATGAAQRFGQQAATSWMQQQRQQQPQAQDPAAINQGAAGRLAGAGVSVPGFGIGGGSSTQQRQQVPMPSAQQVQSAASFASGAASRFGQQSQQQHGQSSGTTAVHGGQLGELQQRFAKMGSPGASNAPAGQESGIITAAAQKKPPPPPPPKKAGLQPGSAPVDDVVPPPVPMSSKPKW